MSLALGCRPATNTVNAANVYQTACARCHGTRGTGGLPPAEDAPPPRDFTDLSWQASRTDVELLGIVTAGRGAMPAFGEVLSPLEIEAAVQHVRSFAERGGRAGESF